MIPVEPTVLKVRWEHLAAPSEDGRDELFVYHVVSRIARRDGTVRIIACATRLLEGFTFPCRCKRVIWDDRGKLWENDECDEDNDGE